MSEQQQPKEYIITEEQLIDLLSFSDHHSYQWTKETEEAIRSRPHPAPQVPDDRGWEQGFQDGQASALVDLNIIAEQSRREERERLINLGKDFCAFNHPCALDSLTAKRVSDFLESLREGAGK